MPNLGRALPGEKLSEFLRRIRACGLCGERLASVYTRPDGRQLCTHCVQDLTFLDRDLDTFPLPELLGGGR